MKKILLTILIGCMVTLSAFNTADNVYVKDGVSYIKVTVICDGDECKNIPVVEQARLKAVAKLKSVKSWARLLENKGISVFKVEHVKGAAIVTFILCNSYDNKLMDSEYGVEVFYKE